MSKFSIFTFLIASLFLFSSCGDSIATSKIKGIEGIITGAENLNVNFDKINLSGTKETLANAVIDDKASFRLELPSSFEPGFYSLRIGAKSLNFPLNGTEKYLKFTSTLEDFGNYVVSVEGKDLSSYFELLQGLIQRKFTSDQVKSYLDKESDSVTAMAMAMMGLGQNPKFSALHAMVAAKLVKDYPNAKATKEYASFSARLANAGKTPQQAPSGPISVGQPAPDIVLPNVNGKTIKLSDLKGKLVLLDFWASWCGPCRRENPNVVRLYNKYKSKGFTVFSVSLDGMDSRTKARIEGQGRDPKQYLDAQRKRWIDAIAKDKLAWPYHVSDLKKWDSGASQKYGVRSIPRAFMIDKEGFIVETKLRGAAQIEAAIKKNL